MSLHSPHRAVIYFFCVIPLLLTSLQGQPARILRNINVGDDFPAFSVMNLEGRVIDSAGCKGKPMIILFVRPSQKESLHALDLVQEIHRDRSKHGLVALAVSSKPDSRAFLEEVRSEKKLTFDLALDPDRKLYGDLGLVVSPTTLLIDGAGVLRFELPHMPPGYKGALELHADLILGRISQEEHDRRLGAPPAPLTDKEKAFRRRIAFARRLIEKKQFTMALELLKELRTEDKDNLEATVLSGKAFLALDQVSQAVECIHPLRELEAPPLNLRILSARLDIREGITESARRLLQQSSLPSAERCTLLYELGRFYEEQDSTAEALSCYREALEAILEVNPRNSHK